MTIKEIIQKLHITMTDASGQESHFESWMTLNDGIIDAIDALKALDKQEPVTWRNAAIRVGEDLCSVGPFGYYDMTAEQWLDWALSVVTVHAPPLQRTWVGLTDEEHMILYTKANSGLHDWARAIEAKLKQKNTRGQE